MIKYYNKFTTSLIEINNSSTLIIHSLCGCNLNCYNCINKRELITKSHKYYYTIKDIINFLKLNSYLYDYIVLSGGEFLINDMKDIVHDIQLIKDVTSSAVIIYTNGTFPLKIKTLLENNIVDGIHIDMKLPYHYLNQNIDKNIIKEILGVNISQEMIENMALSIEYVIKYDKGLNQIRTIKYPQIDESVFEDNKKYIDELNCKYKKNTLYIINEFININ